jgi:hypothetical protein
MTDPLELACGIVRDDGLALTLKSGARTVNVTVLEWVKAPVESVAVAVTE